MFPALFTAGMSLMDTTNNPDGRRLARAFLSQPKLCYNITHTFASVLLALVVGGVEILGLIGRRTRLAGPPWRLGATLNANFGVVGYSVVALFIVCRMASYLIYKGVATTGSKCSSQ